MSELLEDLKALRELLTSPEKWCQGFLQKENSFCLLGAVCEVTSARPDRRVYVKQALNAQLPYYNSIIDWNDSEFRKHGDVLALIDRTIEVWSEISLKERSIVEKLDEESLIEVLVEKRIKERVLEDA